MKASDSKKGSVVEHNGGVYQIRDIERSAPTARGGNVTYRFTMYRIPDGQKLDVSLRADDEMTELELTKRNASYSYMDGEQYVFMDDEDYTQYYLGAALVGDAAGYITEGLTGCYVGLIDDAPVSLQMPTTVTLEVVDTPPELKGGTATKRPKPAKLSTGIAIQVPEYISNGEMVQVNTETGLFSGRA